jgi:hypothetical protein
MFRRLIPLATLLLAITAAYACLKVSANHSGPPQRPWSTTIADDILGPHTSPAEQRCRAYGWFIFDRAQDRDAGFSRTASLRATRKWNRANDVRPDIQDVHEELITRVYASRDQTPRQLREYIESTCLLDHGHTPRPVSAWP